MTDRYILNEKTSATDDLRIQDVVPLPPPEHLIRFFPIADTPVESLVGDTRQTVRRIVHGLDDRLHCDRQAARLRMDGLGACAGGL